MAWAAGSPRGESMDQGLAGATQDFTRAESRRRNDSLDTPTGATATGAAGVWPDVVEDPGAPPSARRGPRRRRRLAAPSADVSPEAAGVPLTAAATAATGVSRSDRKSV